MLKILVVSHKLFNDKFLPHGYQCIKVGNQISKIPSNWISDSESENNISRQNPWYCELTAQYYAYKNFSYEIDILGLVHYRRYFMNYKKNSSSLYEDILNEKEITNILEKKKIILPFLDSKNPSSSILYKNKPISSQDKQWQIIYKIMKNNFPEYFECFKEVIFAKKQLWFNMFIAKRNIFDSYSEWLFSVLSEYDNEIATLGEKRIPRVDGFLSELLLLVWVKKNIKDNEICFMDVKNIEANKLISYDKSFKNKIFKIFYSNYWILKMYKISKANCRVIYRMLFQHL